MKALLAVLLLGASARAATLRDETLERPEGTRRFTVVTPDKTAEGKRPVLFLLHGHMGSAKQVLGL